MLNINIISYFEVFKDVSGQFRFRLKSSNGQVIATSESYTSKQSCLDGINSVKKNAPLAKIKDFTI